jgi:fructose-1-phosphate kinase PfkB-like protein
MDVVTVTGNLLAEWTFEVVKLVPGATHRAERMSFQVGGKGVNVSRILKHLGLQTEAHGFASGELAELCRGWLREREMEHCFHPLDSGVRPGLVVRESGDPDAPETTFLGLDLAVPGRSWESAMKQIGESKPAWLAICGSIPGWQGGWLESVQALVSDKNIQVCVDTYGPALEDLITLPLELVKINRSELARLRPEMANAGSMDLLAEVSEGSPVRNWIITDGSNPILAAFENGELYEVEPAVIEEASPTGSGDTFLAAILQQSLAGAGPEKMLSHASACASANAASPDIGDFKLPIQDTYRPRVTRL